MAPIRTQFTRFFKTLRLYTRRLMVPLIKFPKLVFLHFCLFLLVCIHKTICASLLSLIGMRVSLLITDSYGNRTRIFPVKGEGPNH